MTIKNRINFNSMINSQQFFTFITALFLLMGFTSQSLYAQDSETEKKPGNSNFTLAISPSNLGAFSIPPVGFMADFGINKWGAFGIYGGYYKWKFSSGHNATFGGRLTAQVFGILNEFLDSPINIPGLKPYVGFALGYSGRINTNSNSNLGLLLGGSSGSIIIGTRYYPSDGIGFMIEIGETFVATTGLNVGISFGGKQ